MFHPDGPTIWELAQQAFSSTRRGYDLLAPKFDLTPYRTPPAVVAPLAPFFEGAKSGIDVCCGTGAGLELMLAQSEMERVVGIDFSQGMLTQAAANLPESSRLELIQGDVLNMEFEQEFDVAICLGALGHFVGSDMEKLYRRIYDALKPGGRLIFPTAPKPRFFSLVYWFCAIFNAALWIRNLVIKPPFIMYYHRLMFDGPELHQLLAEIGFQVEVEEIQLNSSSDGLAHSKFSMLIASRV